MTLTGHNVLTGISFTDDEHYESPNDTRSMVQLGLPPGSAGSMSVDAGPVEDVLVSRDAFVHVGRALLSGGRPIHRLVVTHNEFGAFETALMLTGGRSDPAHPYEVEDSIFRDNLFAPGSYLDIAARQGTVASQIGASHRVDFSGNFADGASRAGLQNPDDPPGWRAGFFWSLANNNEELLISGNRIDCSGDKAGDGEAVSLDANGSTLAFDGVKGIAGAGDDWVSVPAALVRDRDGQPFPTEYIVGQWISIMDGAGLGQTREDLRLRRGWCTRHREISRDAALGRGTEGRSKPARCNPAVLAGIHHRQQHQSRQSAVPEIQSQWTAWRCDRPLDIDSGFGGGRQRAGRHGRD